MHFEGSKDILIPTLVPGEQITIRLYCFSRVPVTDWFLLNNLLQLNVFSNNPHYNWETLKRVEEFIDKYFR